MIRWRRWLSALVGLPVTANVMIQLARDSPISFGSESNHAWDRLPSEVNWLFNQGKGKLGSVQEGPERDYL